MRAPGISRPCQHNAQCQVRLNQTCCQPSMRPHHAANQVTAQVQRYETLNLTLSQLQSDHRIAVPARRLR